jgi:hypothetical protein
MPQPPPSWIAECTFGERRVTLEAKSKSGDPYEDDMELSIQVGKAKLPVGLSPKMFWPLTPFQGLSACDKIVGVPIGQDQALLLFSVDYRATYEVLTGFLLNISSGAVLDRNENLGTFFKTVKGKEFQIEKTESGFRAFMAQGYNEASSNNDQFYHMGWVGVTVQDGKMTARWEKPLPATHKQHSNPDVLPAVVK